MTKTGQWHGLQLTTHESASLVVHDIQISSTIGTITVTILTIAFDIATLSLLLVSFLKGTDTILPVVLSVLGLELLHEGPVEASVASGELIEVVASTLEELLASEVGGVGEGKVFVRDCERRRRTNGGIEIGSGFCVVGGDFGRPGR